ncbi:hypothetical protein Y032_0014g2248 [Ancylostoma ceylanicum]|uniref:Uncharacterized protein n=1 Tax=Ancylostoma ceylanicum TaxID=53326 RepID=A0A016VB79_9BILA|nr:hypothetical protein Y032_0014g2248 [Ancylostoma ceylanicum]
MRVSCVSDAAGPIFHHISIHMHARQTHSPKRLFRDGALPETHPESYGLLCCCITRFISCFALNKREMVEIRPAQAFLT